MPWTLKLTSLVFAPQCSLLKQYVNLPSSFAVKEWSPDETPRSWTWYAREGVSIYYIRWSASHCAAPEEWRLTQKSISRLPLPPNSRSPTWNVTVILSSLCSDSWKHSRWLAFIWMLCEAASEKKLLAAARTAREGNSMFGRVSVSWTAICVVVLSLGSSCGNGQVARKSSGPCAKHWSSYLV
jgi:hypothetical protein